MAGIVEIKKVGKFWLEGSNSEPIRRNCDFLFSDGPTTERRTRSFVQINMFTVLVREYCIVLYNTETPPKQLFVTSLTKVNSAKANKDKQQGDKKLGQMHNP